MKWGSVKQSIVLASSLMLVGILALIEVYIDLSPWVWVAAFAVAGVVAFVVYLTDRPNWSLLVSTYVMLAIAALIALSTLDMLRGEAVAVFALLVIAIPFLTVYLHDRSQWWALIPAYVMLAVASMIGLQEVGLLSEQLTGSYVLFCVAIPFFVVYARNPKQWWFLIPAGVLTIVGLSLLIAADVGTYIVPVILIAAGALIVVRMLRGDRRRGSE